MATWPVTTRARGSLLVLIVVMTLSGCGQSGEPEPIPTVAASPTTPTPTPTPSPSPTETVNDEQAAAERALDRFLQVEATLYADLNAPVSALEGVSYGLGLSQATDYVEQTRKAGIVEQGPTKVISREVTRDKRDDPPTVIITQCLDVSQVEATKNGETYTGVRTDRNLTTYGVSFWENKWQVSYIKLSGPNKC